MAAVILLAGAWLAHAGNLNPPAGPVAPTHKSLTEVEPRIPINATNTPGDADSMFRIAAPGSYYLTGNVNGQVGRMGIEIVASGVSLDLMGFDLLGVAGSLDGVKVSVSGLSEIAVSNGSIRNWGQFGVDLVDAINTRLSDLRVSGNAGSGVFMWYGVISFCTAHSNGMGGIVTSNNCTISDCSVQENSFIGIGAGDNCTINNCSVSSSSSNGISVGMGCTITGCAVRENMGDGISAGGGSTVTGCSAQHNTLDGINVSSGSFVFANACDGNGSGAGDGAGIHAVGDDSRIEGNNCTGNDRGVHVGSGGNLIIRNSASGNTTNYVIVGNNRYGPIINITALGTAAVSGNSAASTLATTDPWANLAF